MRQGEIEAMKGRGQTAAEEATQRRTGEEKMSEREISLTLEERPNPSVGMRGKDRREGGREGGRKVGRRGGMDGGREEKKETEGKQGAADGKGGEILATRAITQEVLVQLPLFFPGGGIITEFI